MVNSVAFVIATIAYIESLKHGPSSIAYQIIRPNAVLVVVFSILSATMLFKGAFYGASLYYRLHYGDEFCHFDHPVWTDL